MALTIPPAPMAAFRAARQWLDTAAGQRLKTVLSLALSAFMLVLLARAIGRIGWPALIAALPLTLPFWLMFMGQYVIQPVTDWLIYRPWWRLTRADIAIFMRKHALNEALLAYSGDGAVVAWAAARVARRQGAPASIDVAGRGTGPGLDPATHVLAAVKDSALTSGLAGNLFTFLMLLLALVLGAATAMGEALDGELGASTLRTAGIGFAGLLALNLLVLVNRRRLFSLPVRDNVRSFAMHFGRASLGHLMLIFSWMFALPMVGIKVWLLLGALRLVISRLPLPNKQLLFAAIAASLAGSAAPDIAALMAAQGVLTLALHVLSWPAAALIDRLNR